MFFQGVSNNSALNSRICFNVRSPGDDEAVFAIDTLEVLKGKLSPRIKGMIVEWAEIHKKELKKNWELLKEDKFNKIKPLE